MEHKFGKKDEIVKLCWLQDPLLPHFVTWSIIRCCSLKCHHIVITLWYFCPKGNWHPTVQVSSIELPKVNRHAKCSIESLLRTCSSRLVDMDQNQTVSLPFWWNFTQEICEDILGMWTSNEPRLAQVNASVYTVVFLLL